MREALRASLIKDERDGAAFDRVFDTYFTPPTRPGHPRERQGPMLGVSGAGHVDGGGTKPPLTLEARPARSLVSASRKPTAEQTESAAEQSKSRIASTPKQKDGSDQSIAAEAKRHTERTGISTDRNARRGSEAEESLAADLVPFADYSVLEYEQAREALAVLQRRLRVRLGRRVRRARAGRIDLRRTLRSSIQRGGALIDLQFRARRPRHIDLFVLADISGSVRYASTLMLELLAGAAACFRRVHNFVYVDRLAAATFEQGHLVTAPNLDRYARSDFGQVLVELKRLHLALLTPATVLIILGDARNNRRPARADLLRDLARRCRVAIWLNPEPSERWGTGDSVIESYSKVIDALLPCGNMRELASGLSLIV
jgi:uncharacterized protein with von Willebrand factor type A (vWA) domain